MFRVWFINLIEYSIYNRTDKVRQVELNFAWYHCSRDMDLDVVDNGGCQTCQMRLEEKAND